MPSRTMLITKVEVIEVDLDRVIDNGGTLDNLEPFFPATGETYNVLFAITRAGVHDAALAIGFEPDTAMFETKGNEVITSLEFL